MKRNSNRSINNYISNANVNVTRFNASGIITNNQHYLQMVELNQWEPPSDWLQLPKLQPDSDTAVMLLAIFKGASGATGASADSNFFTIRCFTQSSAFAGNYVVDWGITTPARPLGVTTSHSSSTSANFQYNWADVPDSTLTSEGYKQVIITVSRTGFRLTGIALNLRHPLASTGYMTGLLDFRGSGSLVNSLAFTGVSPQVLHPMLRRIEWVGPSSLTSLASWILSCNGIEKIMGQEFTANLTTGDRLCNSRSLSYLDLLDTRKVISASFMFSGCFALQTIPPLHLGNVTTTSQLFRNCVSLKNVPYLDLGKMTNFSLIFDGCRSLRVAPQMNTSSATNFGGAFQNCESLHTVPVYNTSNVTDFSSAFLGCTSLQSVPLFDTSKGTIFSNMFQTSGIIEPPQFDFSSGRTFTGMFQDADNMVRTPAYRFPSATGLNGFFAAINLLTEVGELDLTGVTSGSTGAAAGPYYNMFTNASNPVSYLKMKGLSKSINLSNMTLGPANLNDIFDKLADVGGSTGGATITITNNWGTRDCNRSIATAKGWTVVG